jgi:photosystem II stability/assembly factor-like uncharacterized protein
MKTKAPAKPKKRQVRVQDIKPKKDAMGGITTAGGGVWKTKDGGTTWIP